MASGKEKFLAFLALANALLLVFLKSSKCEKEFRGLRNTDGAQISIFPKAKNDVR
jgi:hypothetical protein